MLDAFNIEEAENFNKRYTVRAYVGKSSFKNSSSINILSFRVTARTKHFLRNHLNHTDLFLFSWLIRQSLCVCQQDISESREWISMKFGGQALSQGTIDYILVVIQFWEFVRQLLFLAVTH